MSARARGRGRLRRTVDGQGRTVYVADYIDAQGQRHRRHVAGDRATAERVLAKLIQDRDLEEAGLGQERGLDLAVTVLVGQYLAELATRCRGRAVEETRKMLARIVSGLPAVLVRDITKARVVAWRQRRSREGAANKTINNAVVALMAALNFAVSIGQLQASPLAGLRALPITAKHQRRRPRALTPAELGALLAEAACYDAAHPSLIPRAPLLTFLAGTGARWSESTATRWGDLDLAAGTITLRGETTKTEATRTLPLHEDVIAALRLLLEHETRVRGRAPFKGDPIFRTPEGAAWAREGRNFRRYLGILLKRAGIPYRDETGRVIHIHALRHTFATRLARANVPVAVAARLTGHKTVAMLLQVYTHVAAEDAHDAIRSLPHLRSSPPAENTTPAKSAESA